MENIDEYWDDDISYYYPISLFFSINTDLFVILHVNIQTVHAFTLYFKYF